MPRSLAECIFLGLLERVHSLAQPHWPHATHTQVLRTMNSGGYQTPEPFMGRSVRTERRRYTEWDGRRRGVEPYDYVVDPHERVNFADDPGYAEAAVSLRRLLPTQK